MYRVNIVGAGRVAAYMANALHGNGLEITGLYNRTQKNADNLAHHLGIKPSKALEELPQESLFLVCVSDDAVQPIISQLAKHLPSDAKIVHTSGTLGVKDISRYFVNVGSIWPIYSISTPMKALNRDIPLCIDAMNAAFLAELHSLGGTMSDHVIHVPSDKKQYLHLAAVFANNFSNHMFHMADMICSHHDLDFEILLPMIKNNINTLKDYKPSLLQTGPAIRGDEKTMKKHQEILKSEQMRQLYIAISKSIILHKK